MTHKTCKNRFTKNCTKYEAKKLGLKIPKGDKCDNWNNKNTPSKRPIKFDNKEYLND